MRSDDKLLIFHGNVAHCVKYPDIELIEDGFIIVKDSKIVAVGGSDSLEEEKLRLNAEDAPVVHLKRSQLLIPGFVDTHIHAVQYPNSGLGYDKPLLDWLKEYTFPLEMRMRNEELAERVFEAVVKKTLSHGTTTAMYFGSLYDNICMLLVEAVVRQGQRALLEKSI
ncbi:hypothetical protein WA026_018014 [Henosepilachna vigintioctopunctata]|uniref:Amidohydrolase-related domain-containing protein n=1 Tax=Henosepilachna vigintioctopunctata TaxID=420089 RepID=A0AAW1TVC2_9CUCU